MTNLINIEDLRKAREARTIKLVDGILMDGDGNQFQMLDVTLTIDNEEIDYHIGKQEE